MDATYELWDVEAGNLIGTFESKTSALTIVRELIDLNGTAYAAVLELGRHTSSGDFQLVGSGADLAELSNSPDPAHGRVSPR